MFRAHTYGKCVLTGTRRRSFVSKRQMDTRIGVVPPGTPHKPTSVTHTLTHADAEKDFFSRSILRTVWTALSAVSVGMLPPPTRSTSLGSRRKTVLLTFKMFSVCKDFFMASMRPRL